MTCAPFLGLAVLDLVKATAERSSSSCYDIYVHVTTTYIYNQSSFVLHVRIEYACMHTVRSTLSSDGKQQTDHKTTPDCHPITAIIPYMPPSLTTYYINNDLLIRYAASYNLIAPYDQSINAYCLCRSCVIIIIVVDLKIAIAS